MYYRRYSQNCDKYHGDGLTEGLGTVRARDEVDLAEESGAEFGVEVGVTEGLGAVLVDGVKKNEDAGLEASLGDEVDKEDTGLVATPRDEADPKENGDGADPKENGEEVDGNANRVPGDEVDENENKDLGAVLEDEDG